VCFALTTTDVPSVDAGCKFADKVVSLSGLFRRLITDRDMCLTRLGTRIPVFVVSTMQPRASVQNMLTCRACSQETAHARCPLLISFQRPCSRAYCTHLPLSWHQPHITSRPARQNGAQACSSLSGPAYDTKHDGRPAANSRGNSPVDPQEPTTECKHVIDQACL